MEIVRRNEVLKFNFEEKIPFLKSAKQETFLPDKMKNTIGKFLEMIERKRDLPTSTLEKLKHGILALELKMKDTVHLTKQRNEPIENNDLKTEPRKGPTLKSNFDKYQLESSHTYVPQLIPKQEKFSGNKPEKWYYSDNERTVSRSNKKSNTPEIKDFINLTIDSEIDNDIKKIASAEDDFKSIDAASTSFKYQDYRQKFNHLIKKKTTPAISNELMDQHKSIASIEHPIRTIKESIPAIERISQNPSSNKAKDQIVFTAEYDDSTKPTYSAENMCNFTKEVSENINETKERRNRDDGQTSKINGTLLDRNKSKAIFKFESKSQTYKTNEQRNRKLSDTKYFNTTEKNKIQNRNNNKKIIASKEKLDKSSSSSETSRNIISNNKTVNSDPLKSSKSVSSEIRIKVNHITEEKESISVSKSSNISIQNSKGMIEKSSHITKFKTITQCPKENRTSQTNCRDGIAKQNFRKDEIHSSKESSELDMNMTNVVHSSTKVKNTNKNSINLRVINENRNDDIPATVMIEDSHMTINRKCNNTDENISKQCTVSGAVNTIGDLSKLVQRNDHVKKKSERTFEVQLVLSAFQQHRNEKQFRNKQRANKRKNTNTAVRKSNRIAQKITASKNLVKTEPDEELDSTRQLPDKNTNENTNDQQTSEENEKSQHSIDSTKEQCTSSSNINDSNDQIFEVINVPIKLENEEESDIPPTCDVPFDIEPLIESDNMALISHIDIIKMETDSYAFSSTIDQQSNDISGQPSRLDIKIEPVEQNMIDDSFNVSNMSETYEFKTESLPMIKEELIELDEQDFLTYQHRISNLAYLDSPISFLFLCKVAGCSFYNGDRKIFLEHINEHHSNMIWDGFCYKCESSITANDTTLHDEYKHLLRVHVNKNDCIGVTDDDDDDNTSYKPALKIRRIDDLTNQGETLFSSTPIINTNNILKPWTSGFNPKQEDIVKVMLEPKNISKHFKCMENTCKYSCSNAEVFFSHLMKHEAIRDSKEYLSCCYCSFASEDVLGFKEHFEEHKMCNFQCRYCFFRGVRQLYVIKHQDLFHKNQPKSVIKCGDEASFEFDYLMEQLNRNISLYQCPSCEFKSYIASSFELHLQTHLSKEIKCTDCGVLVDINDFFNHTTQHNLNIRQCLFCKDSFGENETILDHLIVQHNGAFPPFYCKRVPSNCSRTNQTGEVIQLPLICKLPI